MPQTPGVQVDEGVRVVVTVRVEVVVIVEGEMMVLIIFVWQGKEV